MIGVFGDSFVEYHYKLYPTWFSDYETYGFGGSDIWYSYNKFMENHERYDRIIFALTNPYRVSKLDEEDGWYFYCNPQSCRHKADLHPTFPIMEQYLTHVATIQDGRDEMFCDLLQKEIQRIRPDTLFVKCFHNSPGPDVTDLHSISRVESGRTKLMDWVDNTENLVDIRMAHLTEESHNIIRDDVVEALNRKDTWLDLDIEKFQDLNIDKSRYFVPLDSPLNFRRIKNGE